MSWKKQTSRINSLCNYRTNKNGNELRCLGVLKADKMLGVLDLKRENLEEETCLSEEESRTRDVMVWLGFPREALGNTA